MKKWSSLCLACAVGSATGVFGQTTIFDSSAGSYTVGDLEGQNNWTQLLNYDTNGVPVASNQLSDVAFTVDNSSWLINDAASDAAFLVETNAAYVYLDEVSAGNELYSEWTGEMDFSFNIPQGTYAGAGTLPNANFFAIGLTASTTNGLSQFDGNDVIMLLRYRANNRLDMQLCSEQDADLRIFQTPSDDSTWAEPVGQEILGMNPQTGDCQSDELHLTWTIRKTSDGNYLGWGSVSNTVTGAWVDDIRTNGLGGRVVSTEGKNKAADVHASFDPVLAMGRHGAAYAPQYEAFGNGLLDIDIESLTVTKSIVSPALAAPANVVAVEFDSQVTVSWDAAPEATSYDVFRATSSGGYTTAFTNLNGLTVVDTGLSNNQEYFYVVQAVYDTVNSTNSLEVSATPAEIFTGSLVATSFAVPDYSDADLAGQQGWLQVSGSSNNAFNVINSGSATSAIDTVSTEGSFSTNVGNAVYLNKLTDNNANDAWDGYFDFQVSATGTNINNQHVFAFGVTSDNDAPLFLSGGANDQMALMSLLVRANGKLVALGGTELNDTDDTRLAVLIGDTETGWNPDNGASSDLVSDVIRYEWKIRKTTIEGTYQISATLSNTVSGTFGDMQTIVPYDKLEKSTMYNALGAQFAMGHYYKSRLTPASDLVNITILDMEVNHSSDNEPQIQAPSGLTAIGGDRSVGLSWQEAFEASDYDVLFAETEGGAQTLLTTITGQTYLDEPRFNGVTGWYTVRANFAAGSADTSEIAGTPEASVTALNFDGTDLGLTGSQVNLGLTDGLVTNGSMMYIDNTVSPLIANGEGAYTGPTFHGLTQIDVVGVDITDGRGDIGFRLANNQDNNGSLTDNFEYRQNGGAPRGECLWYVESTNWDEPQASVDPVNNNVGVLIANKLLTSPGTQHIAIRNGASDWYISQASAGNGTSGALDTLGTLFMPNLRTNLFGSISVTPGTLIAQPGAWDTVENLNLTDITAIGWLADNQIRIKPVKLIVTVGGSIPSTQYWMDQYDSVTNLTDDTDGDLLSNLKEYAFGGNPEDANDQGTLPEYTAANVDGTNGFIVVHHELRDPTKGINYSLETDESLAIAGGWTPVPEGDKLGEEDIDYFTKAVSNFVPADVATKFIDLKVNEL